MRCVREQYARLVLVSVLAVVAEKQRVLDECVCLYIKEFNFV